MRKLKANRLNIKSFVKVVAADIGTNLKRLCCSIGRGKNSALSNSLRKESLRIIDLKKILDVAEEPLEFLYKGKGVRVSFDPKHDESLTINQFVKTIASDLGISLKRLGSIIGRGDKSSLCSSLRKESLRLRDLSKILEVANEPLIILYKGNSYEIEFEPKTEKDGK